METAGLNRAQLDRLKKELEVREGDLPSLGYDGQEIDKERLQKLKETLGGASKPITNPDVSFSYGLGDQEFQRIRQEVGYEEAGSDPFESRTRPLKPKPVQEPDDTDQEDEQGIIPPQAPIPNIPIPFSSKKNTFNLPTYPYRLRKEDSLEEYIKENIINDLRKNELSYNIINSIYKNIIVGEYFKEKKYL